MPPWAFQATIAKTHSTKKKDKVIPKFKSYTLTQMHGSTCMTKTPGQHAFFLDYIMELRNSMEHYMPISGVEVHH